MDYLFRAAIPADLPPIWEIIQQAKAQMYREKRQQWSEAYPAIAHIEADIARGYARVLCHAGEVIAYAAVVFDGEPAYEVIQGAWLSLGDYVVVHRVAVADRMKQRGIATILMQEVEKLAAAESVRSFKVDTNFDNLGMQGVLLRCGFTYCGEIFYAGNPRRAYEKII